MAKALAMAHNEPRVDPSDAIDKEKAVRQTHRLRLNRTPFVRGDLDVQRYVLIRRLFTGINRKLRAVVDLPGVDANIELSEKRHESLTPG